MSDENVFQKAVDIMIFISDYVITYSIPAYLGIDNEIFNEDFNNSQNESFD